MLAAGETREIDVGEVNGKRFSWIASCGFDSDANRIANEASWSRAASCTPTRRCARWSAGSRRPSPSRSTASASELPRYGVAAANSRAYGGGMYVAPDAELDDGLLDVVTLRRRRQDALPPRACRRSSTAATSSMPEIGVRRAAEVRIEADRPFAVYADGDHIADLPATVSLLPRALRVIVPAPGAAG